MLQVASRRKLTLQYLFHGQEMDERLTSSESLSWISAYNPGCESRIGLCGCFRCSSYDGYHIGILSLSEYFLFNFSFSLLLDINELKTLLQELKYRIGIQSARLLRQLKQKDRLVHKVQKNCDIVTACLQAVSQKRSKCRSGVSPVAVWDQSVSEAGSVVSVFLNICNEKF